MDNIFGEYQKFKNGSSWSILKEQSCGIDNSADIYWKIDFREDSISGNRLLKPNDVLSSLSIKVSSDTRVNDNNSFYSESISVFSSNMVVKEKEWQNAVDMIIREDLVEFCERSLLEEFFINTLKSFDRNSLIPQNWILNYYFKNANDESKVVHILHAISRIPCRLCGTQIFSIAGQCLSNKNPEVIEFALKAYENWRSKETLAVLASVKLSYNWLNSYLYDVIAYIEEGN